MSQKSVRSMNTYWILKYHPSDRGDERREAFDLGERFLRVCCIKLALLSRGEARHRKRLV